MSRITYVLRRIAETSPRVLVLKVWLRAKPRLYAGVYRRRPVGWVRPTHADVDRVTRILTALPTKQPSANYSDYSLRASARAASALAGRFVVLGYGETGIPSGTGWHCDPFHGYRWPCDYFPDVDFLAAHDTCDVKIPWELNRLQFLPWLAEAARFGEHNADTCLSRFEAVLADWTASNPAGFGVNWTCGMEVAIRAVNMVFAAALVADRLSHEGRTKLVGSLFDHRAFIRRFPEYSDVPGNHYLADLMGLAVLDCALDGPNTEQFRRSVENFAVEAERQFGRSGVHLEHSTVYHRLCMDMVMIVHSLATHAPNGVAKRLVPVLERSLHFASAVASTGGILPIFGDSDSGHVLWFGGSERRLDALRCYCLGEPPAEGHGDLAYFLSAFRRDATPLFNEAAPNSGIYDPFVVLRQDLITLIVRHGPQGLRGRAPHDHDDALGFWMFIGDEDLFVDAGCLGYTLCPEARRAVIVSTAHPVWSPAGCDRFKPVDGSIFLTVRGAPAATIKFHKDRDAIICELELRGNLDRSLLEHRRFSLSQRLLVNDFVRLRSADAIQMVLRLGPAFEARASDLGAPIVIKRRDGANVCHLQFKTDGALKIDVGEDWWAPQYGRAEPISAIRLFSGSAIEHIISWTLTRHGSSWSVPRRILERA